MFSFFSRKPIAEPTGKSSSTNIINESSTQLGNNEQLRTPSPSVDSAISKHNHNLSPSRDAVHGPPITPSPPPPDVNAPDNILDKDLGLIVDPSALHSLISSVPSKTVHEYILTHLIPPARSSTKANTNIHPPSSLTLTHLTSFFSSLSPPPQLHCVRCHKFYYEVENAERSCLVPHDDESAEVERVGLGRGADTQYETLYNCCGRTVEGEGDMGPPDGWCYEGKHTSDTKRARFRADSTMYDDKLTSCDRLKCFEPPALDDSSSESESPSRRPRKRKRSARKREEADAEEQSIGDVQMDGIDGRGDDDDDARSITSTRSQSRLKKKLKSVPTSPLASTSASAPISAPPTLTTKSTSASASKSTSKPRKKRAKAKHDDKPFKPEASPFEDDDDEDMDVDDSASITTKRKAKRVSRTTITGKGKAKASDSTSAVEFPTAGATGSASPSSRSSPTRPDASASGDERRQRRRSQHSLSVSFAPTMEVALDSSTKAASGSVSKLGSKSVSSSSKQRSTNSRPQAKKKSEEVLTSSVDGGET
ncbi:hypothetical protein C8J55DRAFT_525465 [Lentinula edodes]|uniref:Uncharacterized protein n=1 Tax=Lentinula lateritia TaxID=40482 RepID=A0A9W9DG78_9AGAR|nr:hypothetical protein C8J55DRAFT_525465 [Lentinula edodes]